MNSCNLTVADKQAISRTTAQSMTVQSQYVQFISCNVSTAARRKLTTVSGISVKLQARVSLVDFNSKNATNVYNQLLNKLSTSVSSGNFTKTLQKVSVELGASSTKNATINQVSFSQVAVQNPPTILPTQKPSYAPKSPHASSNKRLSVGEIIGIVIGCVAFVVLLLSFVYYYWMTRKSSRIVSFDSPEQQLVLSEINVAAV